MFFYIYRLIERSSAEEFAEWNQLFLSSFFLRVQYFLNLKVVAFLLISYDYALALDIFLRNFMFFMF